MSILNELFQECVVMNVASEVERMKHFDTQATKIGLKYRRFDAFGHEKLVAAGLIDPNLDPTIPENHGLIGRTGCSLSHKTVLQECYDAGHTCCIFEDDATFVNNFEEDLRRRMNTIPWDWNFMHVSCGLERGDRAYANADWMWIGNGFWGMWCYGFRNLEAMRITLEFHARVKPGRFHDTSFRNQGFGNVGTGIHAYRPTVRIVTQGKFPSTTKAYG